MLTLVDEGGRLGRRAFLRVGSMGLAGMTLPGLLAAKSSAAAAIRPCRHRVLARLSRDQARCVRSRIVLPIKVRVIFSGPVDREVTIPPGAKQSVNLPGGSYKVVGRLSAPNILPLYGQETYTSGEECGVRFYIGPNRPQSAPIGPNRP